MNQQILTNCYILIKEKKKYEWYKNNLMTYLDNLKDGNFISNMDSHFSTHNSHGFTNYNFVIIHHQTRGNELENSRKY